MPNSTWYSNQGEKGIANPGFIKVQAYMIYFSFSLAAK